MRQQMITSPWMRTVMRGLDVDRDGSLDVGLYEYINMTNDNVTTTVDQHERWYD
jgi:hypothetical protein